MTEVQFQYKKLEALNRSMEVLIPMAEVKKAFEREYRKAQQNIQRPGFRKGRVPVEYIRKNHFSGIQQEVAQSLVSQFYIQGLQKNSLNPAGSPKFDLKKSPNEDEDFQFKVFFEVHPHVEVQVFENFQLRANKKQPGEEDVSRVIEKLRDDTATITPVLEMDYLCQKGDLAYVDLSGEVQGGEKLPLQKNIPIEVGKGIVFKEIEEKLMGMQVNSQNFVQKSFLKDHPQFSGRTVRFDFTVKKISRKNQPTADDQWALQFFKEKKLEDLKKKILKDLMHSEENRFQSELRSQVLKQLVEANPLELPKTVVQVQKNHMTRDFAESLKRDGVLGEKIQQYIKNHDHKISQDSIFMVHSDYLIHALAKKLKLAGSLEETKKRMNPSASKEELESFHWRLTREKVLSYIISKSKIS